MHNFLKQAYYYVFVLLTFLFLNTGIRAKAYELPGNTYNYSIEIENGFYDENEDMYYLVDNDLELIIDQNIINNETIKTIAFLEYGFGDTPVLLNRGETNFSSSFSYDLKNVEKGLKEVVILLLREQVVNPDVLYIDSSIVLTINQLNVLSEDSFSLIPQRTPNEQGMYKVEIVYNEVVILDLNNKIEYYLDPDINDISTLPADSDHFYARSGYYYVTIRDYFGNHITKGVRVGYGRIDEITISSNDPLTQILGSGEIVTIHLNIIALGENITSNVPGDLEVEWVIDGNSFIGTLAEGFSKYLYEVPDNKNSIGRHEIYAKVENHFSNIIEITINNNNRPSLTLNGPSTVIIEGRVDQYVELGATAIDDIDGDISENVIIDFNSLLIAGLGRVAFKDLHTVEAQLQQISNKLGNFRITYYVYDSHDNVSIPRERWIQVVDTLGPEITLNGDDVIYIDYGEPYVELGATAYDAFDGEVDVTIDASSLYDTFKVGIFLVRYTAVDKVGNASLVTRSVIIGDSIPPIVTLLGNSNIILNYKANYIEFGASVEDNVDGNFNITPTEILFNPKGLVTLIDVTDTGVDTNNLGVYTLKYYYTDTSGNLSNIVIRTVEVKDMTPPVINLKGNKIQLIIFSTENPDYLEPGYTATDNYDGDITDQVVIMYYNNTTNEVVDGINTRKDAATYTITYTVSDSSDNEVSTTRTVAIANIEKPIVELKGSSDLQYEYLDEIAIGSFEEEGEYGYVVRHNVPNVDVYVDIYINGVREVFAQPVHVIETFVNTNDLHFFEIHYYAIDDSGNETPEDYRPIRTIKVVDTTPPEIVLEQTEFSFPLKHNINTILSEIRTSIKVYDAYDDVKNPTYDGLTIQHYIDINKMGFYIVNVNATDSSGNSAQTKRITVEMVDNSPPVIISIIGSKDVVHERGTVFREQYAIALDNYDGELIINNRCYPGWETSTTGYVGCYDFLDENYNPTEKLTGMFKGTYYVVYYAKDSAGNFVNEIAEDKSNLKKVIVIDTISPTVFGLEEGRIGYNYDIVITFESMLGTDEVVKAIIGDREKGEVYLSGQVISNEGSYMITVFDDFGNETIVNFYIDKIAPVISYPVDNHHYKESIIGDVIELKYEDSIDVVEYQIGNKDWISVSRYNLNLINEGRYQLRVRDAAGNYSEIITFYIDKTPPLVQLSPDTNHLVTNQDVFINLLEPNLTVWVNNALYEDVNIPLTESGYYRVTVEDRAGNRTFLQFVIMKENTVITIDGDVEIDDFVALSVYREKITIPKGSYIAGSGYIVTYPNELTHLDFRRQLVHRFTQEQLNTLLYDDLVIAILLDTSEYMGVAFVLNEIEMDIFIGRIEEAKAFSFAVAGAIGAIILFIAFILAKNRKRDDRYYIDIDEVVEEIEEIEE